MIGHWTRSDKELTYPMAPFHKLAEAMTMALASSAFLWGHELFHRFTTGHDSLVLKLIRPRNDALTNNRAQQQPDDTTPHLRQLLIVPGAAL